MGESPSFIRSLAGYGWENVMVYIYKVEDWQSYKADQGGQAYTCAKVRCTG